MLIFQIKRIISSEKWFNYVVTFFFLKKPQIWVGPTTLAKWRKKRGWPYQGQIIIMLRLRCYTNEVV